MNFDHFGAQNAKWPPKVSKKHQVFHSKWMQFYDFAKRLKPLVKQRFETTKKVDGNTL